ncbi:MAG TPA: hypothetical protein VNL77_24860 [Roseiflexaceae bacterium]|nr:hypothetical protein [Roseiflexaceae bacterium]
MFRLKPPPSRRAAPPQPTGPRPSIGRDLRAGLDAVLRNRYIRLFVLCSAPANVFINMHLAIYVLYLTREVGFAPATIGTLYTLGVERIIRRLGFGRAIVTETHAVGLAATAIPFASLAGDLALPLLLAAHLLWSLWLPVYTVNAAALRQAITPNHLLGQVTASGRCISWGAVAVGFLIGGAVAEQIGLLPALAVAGPRLWASALWVIRSPIRALAAMPTASEGAA